jgi:hypothetical protein
MTYEVELKAAIAACDKVHNAEQNVKHLVSYRLEAGERIRAAYKAGEAEGKTKAEVAKDIGFAVSWVRELANNDTPEKVATAKAKKAATAKKLRSKSPLRSSGQKLHDSHGDAAGERDGQAADPARNVLLNEANELLKRAGADIAFQQEQADEGLAAYKEAWLEYCLPHAQKILANDWRSPMDHINLFSAHWHEALCWENAQIHKITKRLRDDERVSGAAKMTGKLL